MATSSPITIAASGNWLLGHDRIGPQVLELIRGRYDSTVELCDLGASALALLDFLRAQEMLIVVDACVGAAQPGEVIVLEPKLEQDLARETSVHQIGPVETLVIADHLYPELVPRRIKLVLVETGGLGESEEIQACHRVVEILDRELGLHPRIKDHSMEIEKLERGDYCGSSTGA